MDESLRHYTSEISQTQKKKYTLWFHLNEQSRKGEFTETEGRTEVTRVCGKGKMESDSLMSTEFLFEMMTMF